MYPRQGLCRSTFRRAHADALDIVTVSATRMQWRIQVRLALSGTRFRSEATSTQQPPAPGTQHPALSSTRRVSGTRSVAAHHEGKQVSSDVSGVHRLAVRGSTGRP